MREYSAYGLNIHSEVELPELYEGSGSPDVSVRLGRVARSDSQFSTMGGSYWATSQGLGLFWEECGAFEVRSGREIVVEPLPGAEEARLRLFILGACLGALLHQRGLLVFHGSAVVMEGSAAMFLGEKGWGKSTIAATLCRLGAGFLADDVVAVRQRSDGPLEVLPAFPQMKLWPDALESLGEDVASLPKLTARLEKRHFAVHERFQGYPARLRHIFVLEGGPRVSIEPLRQQEALLHLVRSLYAARFSKVLLEGDGSHFIRCAELVRQAWIDRLQRPASLSMLPATAQLVRRQLAHATVMGRATARP